ncbi:NAD(P)/FAD-dependent oxidoreductase [Rothia uropygioeca]|nr:MULTISPECIES: NAD(P)/FAD-dependent oxidoreductase [unclassified Kocuria]
MTNPHIVVVGAGFSGLVAARELHTAGFEVEVVEARDRIGGRAWTDERMGHTLEMGATWVHWMQPHVWSEITRYGQTIYPSPYTDQAYWVTNGEVRSGSEADIDRLMERPMNAIFEGSKEFFPYPHNPLHVLSNEFDGPEEIRQRFLAADQTSVLDILRQGDFSQEEIDLCDSYWSAGYIGDPNRGSSLMAKQWVALSDHRQSLMDDQTLRFKLTNGMRGIYQNIAQDLNCPLRLNTPVSKIRHDASSSVVTLENGESIACDAVIVTVPLGALENIEFEPGLPPAMRSVLKEKWNSTGCKTWIKIKGHHSIFGYAPTPARGALLRSEYFLPDGDTICVCFGSQHDQVDVSDPKSAQKIVDQWRPDLEVVDCTGHDWVADKWSGQAWATLKKGQFTNGWHHFHETGTRLRFAGADWAQGWRGVVVDGAIETGLSASRRLIRELA